MAQGEREHKEQLLTPKTLKTFVPNPRDPPELRPQWEHSPHITTGNAYNRSQICKTSRRKVKILMSKRKRIFTILNSGIYSSLHVGSNWDVKRIYSITCPLHRYCPEHVETRQSCGDHHARDLRVPVDLLDLFLPLVQEQELRRQVLHSLHPGPHVTWLHRQIPLADHVVRSGGGEHTRVCGAPLHRGDGGAVLLEVCYRSPALQVKPESSGVSI